MKQRQLDLRQEVKDKSEDRVQAWLKITKAIEQYSDEVVDQWNRGIDVLLTFVST